MYECFTQPLVMLGIMFALHFFADFNLQIGSGMDKFKQRRWWREQIPEDDRVSWERYKNDYTVALLCHAAYWAIIVCLPLAMCGGTVYSVNVMIHGTIHSVVDDLKANELALNLKWDQIIHAVQVMCVWTAWVVFR